MRDRPTAVPRRPVLAAFVVLLACAFARDAIAEAVDVPIAVQAELLAKVAPYDRNFAARAAGHVQVLVVAKPSDADSNRVARQMMAALAGIPAIGGLPHTETVVAYRGGPALATSSREARASIIYLASSLEADLPEIREALEDHD